MSELKWNSQAELEALAWAEMVEVRRSRRTGLDWYIVYDDTGYDALKTPIRDTAMTAAVAWFVLWQEHGRSTSVDGISGGGFGTDRSRH
jgi:hypothetical protein